MLWMAVSSRQERRKSPFPQHKVYLCFLQRPRCLAFNKEEEAQRQKKKAEKREKKSLQAVPPAVPEACIQIQTVGFGIPGVWVWIPGHEGDVLRQQAPCHNQGTTQVMYWLHLDSWEMPSQRFGGRQVLQQCVSRSTSNEI